MQTIVRRQTGVPFLCIILLPFRAVRYFTAEGAESAEGGWAVQIGGTRSLNNRRQVRLLPSFAVSKRQVEVSHLEVGAGGDTAVFAAAPSGVASQLARDAKLTQINEFAQLGGELQKSGTDGTRIIVAFRAPEHAD